MRSLLIATIIALNSSFVFAAEEVKKEEAAVVEAAINADSESKPEKVEMGPIQVEEPTLDEDTDLMVGVIRPIMDIITNWKKLGVVGSMIAFLNIVIVLMKSKWAGTWFKKQGPKMRIAVIVVLGQVQGLLVMMTNGSTFGEAVLAGLLTSGGAVAIWEMAIKPFLSKEKSAA